VFGIVALAGIIAVLIVWKRGEGAPPAQTVPAAPQSAAPEPSNLPHFSPPPPPPVEEDAGTTADAGAPKTTRPSGDGALATPCTACGKGESSGELNARITGTAGLARGCYQRALRAGGAEGSITVSVSVGNDGSVCGASVVSDTLGSAEIRQCVLSKFRGQAYPKPKRGCVVINVPINFKMK
jgi:outer membrane biosynthesis protein TonB